jgi:hypothetical protein
MGASTLSMIANRRRPGTTLAQKSESLAGDIDLLVRQAGDVAARPRKAGDQAGADRVSRRREHDRNDRCRLLYREDWCGSPRDNDIDLEPDQFGRDLGESLAAAFGPAILDRHGATLDPTENTQPLHKSVGPLALGRRRIGAQEPDAWELPRLLRARRERPYGRSTAEKCDELAPPHGISSWMGDWVNHASSILLPGQRT